MTEELESIKTKEKPKICAIDLDAEIIKALRKRGLQCFAGSLGSQIQVPNSASLYQHPCLLNYTFPSNLHEYDIVIIDLQEREPIEYDKAQHQHSSFKGSEQRILLSKYPETIFDPRPFSASILGRRLNDLFKKESLIIVFASRIEEIEYHPVLIRPSYIDELRSETHHLYNFLPFLQGVFKKMGQQINVAPEIKVKWGNFLSKYAKNFRYEVIFQHLVTLENNQRVKVNNFIPLLMNADDEIISFFYFQSESPRIHLFPQLIDRKKEFVLELIDEILPEIFPEVFPYSEQFSWLKSADYLLPNQTELSAKKINLEDEYKQNISKIEEEIQQNQIKYQFLHDLISETDDLLVKSVKLFFEWLGFPNVIDVDETNPNIKEEDIQIPLENGLLIIEVKGIGGTSRNSDCSQINTIKFRRAEQRGNFDVFALYIVNHQRYLAPKNRKNPLSAINKLMMLKMKREVC